MTSLVERANLHFLAGLRFVMLRSPTDPVTVSNGVKMRCKVWSAVLGCLICSIAGFALLFIVLDSTWTVPSIQIQMPTHFRWQSQNKISYNSKEESGNVTDQEENSPLRNIYFLKIGKTGSTTMYNIFARIALKHRLRVATSKYRPGKIEISGNLIPFLTPPFLIGISKKYNMLIDHSVYFPQKVAHFLEVPFKCVTMIRNPLSWLDSKLNFFERYKSLQLGKDMAASLIDKLSNESYYKGNKLIRSCQNAFSYRLSIKAEGPDRMNTLKKLDDKVLVLINDYFPESMVLMRRRFKWEFKDVLFSALRITDYKHKPFNETLYSQLCKWNTDDCVLYEFFNKTFWQKIHQEKNNMHLEIVHYKSILLNVTKFCFPFYAAILSAKSVNTSTKIEFPSTDWHDSFAFTGMDCLLMRMGPQTYRPLFYYTQNPSAPCEDNCTAWNEQGMCRKICLHANSSITSILQNIKTEKKAYLLH